MARRQNNISTGKRNSTTPSQSSTKPRLLWTAILFAFAGTLLFLTLAHSVAITFFGPAASFWAVVFGPVIAGILTALIARRRGAMHAFIGGMAAIPIIGFFILSGDWQAAIFAGSFCTLGGAITELFLRRQTE